MSHKNGYHLYLYTARQFVDDDRGLFEKTANDYRHVKIVSIQIVF